MIHEEWFNSCCLEMRMALAAGFSLAPELENLQQHDQLQDADDPQKGARDAAADEAIELLHLRPLPLDGRGSEGSGDGQRNDDA